MGEFLRVGLLCGAWAFSALAQEAPEKTPPTDMPSDRVADSYAIYSQLLPSDTIEWGNVPRTQWLVEDTTHAEPVASPCAAGTSAGIPMNPHTSIRPPDDRRAAFAEVLADYDAHCHQRYRLEAARFHLKLPLRLLDGDGQKRFVAGVAGYLPPANDIMRAPATPQDFKGAAGMHSFTAVYFNAEHTLAITEIGMYCGLLCGEWSWVALERTKHGWQPLHWATTYTISQLSVSGAATPGRPRSCPSRAPWPPA